MEWLKELVRNNPVQSLLMPAGLGAFHFVGNVAIALSDGKLESEELRQLLGSASGLETIALIVIVYLLRKKNKE